MLGAIVAFLEDLKHKIFAKPLASVVSDAANTASAFKTDLTETVNDYWKEAEVSFLGGANSGQTRRIKAYNGTTKVVTVDSAFSAVPGDGDKFEIIRSAGGTSAAAVWSEPDTTGGTGSFGKRIRDNLDATISSRASGTDYTAARAALIDELKKIDQIAVAAAPAADSIGKKLNDILAEVAGLSGTSAAAVWSEPDTTGGIGSFGKRIRDNLDFPCRRCLFFKH